MLKKVNMLRRKIMGFLTRNVGRGNRRQNGLFFKREVCSVLICRPNHRLGNLLLVTPLVQEVHDLFPNAKIDLFVKGSAAPAIFKNYKINRIIQLPQRPFRNLIAYFSGWLQIMQKRYDIVINAVGHSSSGRLSARFSNGRFKFFGDTDEWMTLIYHDCEHMAKYPVYSLRGEMINLGFQVGNKKVPLLLLKLSLAEIIEGRKTLDELVPDHKKTICIFTYATGGKIYSSAWWVEFYDRLKQQFYDYNIVEILPAENTSMINFRAPSYYSLDIRKVGSVVANAALFIGADSGMMHLASAVQTPTVGLFKITNSKIYEPYNTGSIAIDTNRNNIPDCLKIIGRVMHVSDNGQSKKHELL